MQQQQVDAASPRCRGGSRATRARTENQATNDAHDEASTEASIKEQTLTSCSRVRSVSSGCVTPELCTHQSHAHEARERARCHSTCRSERTAARQRRLGARSKARLNGSQQTDGMRTLRSRTQADLKQPAMKPAGSVATASRHAPNCTQTKSNMSTLSTAEPSCRGHCHKQLAKRSTQRGAERQINKPKKAVTNGIVAETHRWERVSHALANRPLHRCVRGPASHKTRPNQQRNASSHNNSTSEAISQQDHSRNRAAR